MKTLLFCALVLFVLFIFRNDLKVRFLVWIGLIISFDKGEDAFCQYIMSMAFYEPQPEGEKFFFRQLKYLEKKLVAYKKKKALPLEKIDPLIEMVKKRKAEFAA